jgi:hypothetical protein
VLGLGRACGVLVFVWEGVVCEAGEVEGERRFRLDQVKMRPLRA